MDFVLPLSPPLMPALFGYGVFVQNALLSVWIGVVVGIVMIIIVHFCRIAACCLASSSETDICPRS